MVLDAQPVEDAARLGESVTVRSAAAGLLLGVGLVALMGARQATAADMKALVAPYLQARDAHAVGQLSGHAYGDPQHPSAPPVPYDGVSVLILPYWEGFDSELDGIKEHFRDSLKNYMGAATDVTTARSAYEQALLWAGGGELIRGDVSNPGGMVTLADVPVGDWLVLAWREEARPAKLPRLRPQDISRFRDVPVRAGYSLVSYWRMRLQIQAGETTSVDFNDRNVWLTAVREDLHLIQETPKKEQPTKRR